MIVYHLIYWFAFFYFTILEKYKNIFGFFLVQVKTLKFASKIYWPLICYLKIFLFQHKFLLSSNINLLFNHCDVRTIKMLFHKLFGPMGFVPSSAAAYSGVDFWSKHHVTIFLHKNHEPALASASFFAQFLLGVTFTTFR